MTPNDPKRARIGDRSEAKSGPSIMLIGRRHVYNMRRTNTTSHGRCWPQSVSFPRSVLSVLLGDTGFEQHAETPTKTHIPDTRAAKSAAFSAELQRVIDAWPTLTPATRDAIARIIDGVK